MNGAFSNACILCLSTTFYIVLDFAGSKFLIPFKRVVLVTVRDNTTILINWWQSRKQKFELKMNSKFFLKRKWIRSNQFLSYRNRNRLPKLDFFKIRFLHFFSQIYVSLMQAKIIKLFLYFINKNDNQHLWSLLYVPETAPDWLICTMRMPYRSYISMPYMII